MQIIGFSGSNYKEPAKTQAQKPNLPPPPQDKDKPSAGRIIGGAILGNIAGNITAQLPASIITPICMGKLTEISKNLTKDEAAATKSALDKAFLDSRLKEKGVEIVKASSKNADKIKEIIANEYTSGVGKFYPKSYKNMLIQAQTAQVVNGQNAFCTPKSNKIILPENNQLILGAFHELGHGINKNFGKMGKILQKSRAAALLTVPITLIALFKNKKEEGEEPKNFFDKTADFVKKHAGKLAFATFLPSLIEEGLATYRGNKLASKVLNPELLSKVKATNRFGFASYAAVAISMSIGTYIAKTVRDKFVHPELSKTDKNS